MKKSCYILSGVLIFLCLFCSCSGGTDPGGSTSLEEEGIEENAKDPNKNDSENEKKEDNTEEDGTENIEDSPEEIPPEPIFLYCKTVSEKEVAFGFSQTVKMVDLCFNPELRHEIGGEGRTIKVSLAENLESGQILTADFQAEDAYGNSISKQVLFSSTVTNAPAMQINELRTEYSKPRAEFIELKMLSDGNLSALRVFAAGNDKKAQLFEFAPVKVKEGEYVVLHLRTPEESCKNEYGDSLTESGGTDSSPTARDFWIPDLNELLRKTDAVYVLDQNNWVLDAVMISENSSSLWNKSYLNTAADFLFSKGAWKSPAGTVCSPADAVNSSGTTATRSISRYETAENTHTKADWYVTATSGATPGLPNKL